MTKVYAVAGNPVFHSRSPVMFNTAFRELAVPALYLRLAAASGEEVISTAEQMGVEGINVTSPFKTDIIPFLHRLESAAERIGAVNVVVKEGERFIGHNTDTAGVLHALNKGGFDPKGKKAVVLGAGGAGRAAVFALVGSGAEVVLVNRTDSKAEEAAERLGCGSLPFHRLADALEGVSLLVSTLPVRERVVEPGLLKEGTYVLDANYGSATALGRDAADAGCTVIDGREWLLGQALPAFALFVGRPAPVHVMEKALWKKRRDSRKNIALIGFMGTGKSSVAKSIAALSGLNVIDVDRNIERKAGMTIAEIFNEQGEEAFRRMEQAEIDSVRSLSHHVISCGGGAVLNRANIRVLRNTCISVWLWGDTRTVIERTGGDTTRPLLDVDDREAKAATLLRERIPFYGATSDLVINTAGRKPKELAERIWNEVHNTIED